MSKPKLSLRRLFSNTKFLVIFSIVVAFIFWIVVALEYAPVIENVVENVPVKIDIQNSVPDKLGLQVFGKSDYSIDITVKGNRYDIGGDLITADDFDVVAQTAYVDSSGNHTLKVKASIKDADADYEIISTSTEYIEVYFDRYDEKELELTPRIVTDLREIIDSDYIFDENDIIYTTKTVTVSGAENEVSKINAAYIDISVDDKLTESQTVDASVKLENSSSDEIKYVKINGEDSLDLPVTLPVYKIQTLPVSVSFKNSPSDYLNKPLSYSCYPSEVKVAVMQNGTVSENDLEIGVIDFNEITPQKHTFQFDAADLVDIKVLDNTKTFRVTINADDLTASSYTLNSENISVKGIENINSIDIAVENAGRVTISGRAADIADITDEMLLGSIDLTGVTVSSKGNRVPVAITLNNENACWITGTYYAIVRTK